MNKKLHSFLLLSLLFLIIYLCWDKIIVLVDLVEPFGNQIIILPDGSFDSEKTTMSVLTYDRELDSGYTQVGICSDDNSWTNGKKTCRDYSLSGSNCDDIGSDGRSALKACKVACDNCLIYKEITRRSPSPVEDTEEPSYAQFESSGDSGSTGGADFREVMNRLDEIDQKIEILASSDIEICTDVDVPLGCTPEKCTTDAETPHRGCTPHPCDALDDPYPGCDATCTTVGNPYHGCTQAPCTTDAETPYTGCDTTCTGVDTPYQGCTPAPCDGDTNTPYQGCTPAPCDGDTNTPYPGCTPAQCATGTDNNPYVGCLQ